MTGISVQETPTTVDQTEKPPGQNRDPLTAGAMDGLRRVGAAAHVRLRVRLGPISPGRSQGLP